MIKKVLLIEDDEFIRDLYKRQLDMDGFSTYAFLNGNDGLKAALENQYDLILLDIMLPGMNGLDILRNIKQNEASKNTPVIMLTNLGQEAVIKEGYALGAIGYLIKASFTPDQAVQEIKNILAQNATPTA
jgi:two-component system response regulator ResD